jgi:N-acylneuraminate cytidylyltransferase
MSTLAIVPARGGSVGLPGKNLQTVGGLPLVARAVRSARLAGIARVVVSTDDDAIAATAQRAGAQVLARPPQIADGQASSESALLDVLDQLAASGAALPQVLVFLQATSPFIDADELARAVRRVEAGAADVVFSATESHAFHWAPAGGAWGVRAGPEPEGGRRLVEPVDHPPDHRPRRQDLGARWRETGAFYAMDAAGFRRAGYRFFGRVECAPVRPLTALEIDSPDDLLAARALAPLLDGASTGPPIDVDALVTDFDGVHTDNTATVHPDGSESVAIDRSDGYGIARLRQIGLPLLILSAEVNPIASVRAAKLGIPILLGVADKAAALAAWLAERGLDPARTAYLGNDLGDLPAMAAVGWPCAVADAFPAVRQAARTVTIQPGGRGAVREICDRILAASSPAAAASAATQSDRDPKGQSAQ